MKTLKVFWISFLFLIWTFPLLAEAPKGKIGMGVNVGGIHLRYLFNRPYSVETRAQFEKDVIVAGLRTSRYFSLPVRRLYLLCGLEADYSSFVGSSSSGTGLIGQAVLGGGFLSRWTLALHTLILKIRRPLKLSKRWTL